MAYDAATIQNVYAFFTGNRAAMVAPGAQVAAVNYAPAPGNYGQAPVNYAPAPIYAPAAAPVYGGDQYSSTVDAVKARIAQLESQLANAGRQVQGNVQNVFNAQPQVASLPTPYAPIYAPAMPQAAPAYPARPAYYPAPPSYASPPFVANNGQNDPFAQIAQVVNSLTGAVQNPPSNNYQYQANAQAQQLNYQLQNTVNGLSQNVNQIANSLQNAFSQLGNSFNGVGQQRRW
jgi:hypothetical protein